MTAGPASQSDPSLTSRPSTSGKVTVESAVASDDSTVARD